MPELFTLPDLARLASVPVYRLQYAIQRHGPEPARRVKLMRVWTPEQLPAVMESLRRVQEARRK